MHDSSDDSSLTPRTCDTPVRPQHDRETYRSTGKTTRRPPLWNAGERLGQFTLGPLLGQGSSGFVYEATDQRRHWRCALKILVPETTEDLVRNKLGFRRMLGIRHLHLAKVDQIHRLGEHIALSMELVEGQTFAAAIHELRRWDPYQACERIMELLRQYAQALSVMHAHDLIHRDIKPQNLMVDARGSGRIIDYGLVGTVNPETDPKGMRAYLAGTPQYMAPEVWFDQYYLPAGDVYSLGKVIYEALALVSGNKRLATESPKNFEESGRLQETIHGLGPSVPEILRDACLEMLETNPADRPTALELSRLGTPTCSAIPLPYAHRIYGRQEELSQIIEWLDKVLKGGTGRLHLSGPSGIGKSRLIQEVIRRLATRRWVHVFTACCQYREDQPLQAFDQITDALATRYAKEDLGQLEVDPVSATVLHQAFPVLKSVVTASHKLPAPGSVPARLDALEAAVRLAHQILKTGPMILILDDVQWADRDSLNVLERLQAERAAGLGIITVSRSGDEHQRMPADRHLRIGPLSTDESIAMLEQAARRWSAKLPPVTLRLLAEAAEGSPFRLDELIDEFRPGGAIANGEVTLPPLPTVDAIDALWQTRVARLSPSARRLLTLIAAAGGSVVKDELMLFDREDFPVLNSLDQLREQRLIQPESPDDEAVSIVHDRVADGLIRSLSTQERLEAHRSWADSLLQTPTQQYQAARVAGHLFEAGDIPRAIDFAGRAASDARQRFAQTEAARWHERIIPHVEGQVKIDRVRSAAACYDEADQPVEAARFYQLLASLVSGEEQMEYEIRALVLLTRSGRIDQVRRQIDGLAKRLRIPRPKTAFATKLSLVTRSLQLQVRLKLAQHGRFCSPATSEEDQRIRLCLLLSRPLALVDNLYGGELGLTAALLKFDSGTEAQKIQAELGMAVYGCYEHNALRRRSEALLTELLARARALGDAKTIGDCLTGIGAAHMLSARFQEVIEPSRQGLLTYRECEGLQTFEIAHTHMHELYALWHLGRIRELGVLSQQMFDHSITRNDLLERFIACSGVASSAWLADHRLSEFEMSRRETAKELRHEGLQIIGFFESVARLQRLMYESRWEEAEAELARTAHYERRPPCGRLQICRLQRRVIGGWVSLHQLSRQPSLAHQRSISRSVAALRREGLEYADAVADLQDGYLYGLTDQPNLAVQRFTAARHRSERLGLLPLTLAAKDAADFLTRGIHSNHLEQHLRNEGVSHPDRFANLYCLQLGRSKQKPQKKR